MRSKPDISDTRSYYSSFSENYDKFYSKIQYQKYLSSPKFDNSGGCWKLDLGGGTGLFSKHVTSEFVNIDLALPMLWQDLEHNRSLACIAADMKALPLRSSSVSIIVSFTSLQNSDNIPSSVRELHRISTPIHDWFITILQKSKYSNEIVDLLQLYDPKIRKIPPEDIAIHISSVSSGS